MKEKERQIVINGGDRKKCNKSGNWKKKQKNNEKTATNKVCRELGSEGNGRRKP